MIDSIETTVTLHWYSQGTLQHVPMTCEDQLPQELIPSLINKLALPTADCSDDEIVYELRLDSEQRPALKLKELLTVQGVRDGSRLYLLSRQDNSECPLSRCILRLPDGTEIIVPRRGQELRRAWLLDSVQLHNPEAYRHEIERMAQRHSAYNYVANRNAHCVVQVSDKDYWIVTTDRTDVWTEYTTSQAFDRVPVGAPVRLDNGMRLRLGGSRGLEISVMLI